MAQDPPKVIVGLDSSDESKDALALGQILARALRGELIIAENLDSPASGLPELAESEEAELLVVGSTHRGKLGQVFPGSVGERLLRGAPCGVAVASRGFRTKEPVSTIGVAYNGSPASDRGLSAAIALARRLGAALRVVSVGTRLGPLGSLMDDPAEARARTELRLHRGLDQVPSDVACEGVALEGDAPAELAAQSRSLDLLVVGSRGYGPVRGALLGNVSSELIRRAECPVLVVPRNGLRGSPHAGTAPVAEPQGATT